MLRQQTAICPTFKQERTQVYGLPAVLLHEYDILFKDRDSIDKLIEFIKLTGLGHAPPENNFDFDVRQAARYDEENYEEHEDGLGRPPVDLQRIFGARTVDGL